jgi:Protein of unknown function (DUF1769)
MVSHPRRDEPSSDSSSNSSTKAVAEVPKMTSVDGTAKSPLFRRMKISQFFRYRSTVEEENRERTLVNNDDRVENENENRLIDQTTIVINPPKVQPQKDFSIDAANDSDGIVGSHDGTRRDHRFSRSEPSLTLVDPIGSSLCALPYLEEICGMDTRRLNDNVRRLNSLPDDPSIQESIECVVTAQRDLYSQDREKAASADAAIVQTDSLDNLQTPSSLQQCFLKNRSVSRLPPQLQRDVLSRSPRRRSLPPRFCDLDVASPIKSIKTIMVSNEPVPLPERDAATLVTPVPVVAEVTMLEDSNNSNIVESQCTCRDRHRPVLDPEEWPQRPLLMRPTPNGGTVVKGIRFSSSKEYLWSCDAHHTSELTWPDGLRRHWDGVPAGSSPSSATTTSDGHSGKLMCPRCMVLPINNGKELPGESLVTDFESDLFRGSMLVRLKDCQGTTLPGREQTNGGYFHGLHRRYQVVIRGKFKQAVPWTELMAGFQYVSSLFMSFANSRRI